MASRSAFEARCIFSKTKNGKDIGTARSVKPRTNVAKVPLGWRWMRSGSALICPARARASRADTPPASLIEVLASKACHTFGCITKSLREEHIENQFAGLLKQLWLSQEAKDGIVAEVSKWVDDKIKGNAQFQRQESQLAEIDEKMEALTDALIDRLLDKETFAKRKEVLLLEKTKISEDIEKARDFLAAPDDVRKFLELMKSLAELYENLKPVEKRAFVEIVTSNRIVCGKKLDLEPSKWLEPVLNCPAASYSALSRPETRTFTNWVPQLIASAWSEETDTLREFLK